MNSYNECKEIVELDLDPIKVKLMHKQSGEGWTLAQASVVEAEYRRFLYMMKFFSNEMIAPSEDVDTFWHYHILDTMKYARDCDEVFGYFLHHFPYVGMRGDDDLAALGQAGERMAALYEKTFGDKYQWSLVNEMTAVAYDSGTTGDASTPGANAAYCMTTGATAAYCMPPQATAAAYCMTPTGSPADRMALKAAPAYCMTTKAASAYCMSTKPASAYCMSTEAAPAYCMSTKNASAYCMSTKAVPAYCMTTKTASAYCMSTTAVPAYCMTTGRTADGGKEETGFSLCSGRTAYSKGAVGTVANDEVFMDTFFSARPRLSA